MVGLQFGYNKVVLIIREHSLWQVDEGEANLKQDGYMELDARYL